MVFKFIKRYVSGFETLFVGSLASLASYLVSWLIESLIAK
jgi:hypothetical protein